MRSHLASLKIAVVKQTTKPTGEDMGKSQTLSTADGHYVNQWGRSPKS